MKSDEQCLSAPQSRCAQVASWAQQEFAERCLVGFVLLKSNVNHVLAFRRVDLVNGRSQFQGLFLRQPRSFRVELLFCLDPRLRKKLLRSPTGLSPRAVIAPIDCWHPTSLSF